MDSNLPKNLINDLLNLSSGIEKPFPNNDIKSILVGTGERYYNFTSDLDLYSSDIDGFASSADTLAQRSEDQIDWAFRVCGKSFFETHPKYNPLRIKISKSLTPSLFTLLEICEEAREKLLILLRLLENAKSSEGQ
jgi:hypothetical protein